MASASPGYILYGRRKGKKLRVGKTVLMETLLPRVRVPEEERKPLPSGGVGGGPGSKDILKEESGAAAKTAFLYNRGSSIAQPSPTPPEGRGFAPLDPRTLFPFPVKEIWLEVGFGSGEHLAEQAKAHPDIGMIGCEPFVNGIAGLLSHIDNGKLQNIRILPGDARPLLDRLPDSSLSRVFVLFPDPWPKKRHAERRFIGPVTLPKLARTLKPGAQLRAASDDPTMQEWLKEQLSTAADFEPAPGVIHSRPQDWPPTRYEEKALKAGRKPLYFIFSRKK